MKKKTRRKEQGPTLTVEKPRKVFIAAFPKFKTPSRNTVDDAISNLRGPNNAAERQKDNNLYLTSKFTRAVEYALHIHINCRKGTAIPYIAHLLGVASLLMEENGCGGCSVTEDMVIAALLHDAVEDEGGLPRLGHIEANFGPDVARIVAGCTDSFEQDASNKEEWELRFSVADSTRETDHTRVNLSAVF